MLCESARPGIKTCLKQLACELNKAIIGYKRFGITDCLLVAITRLIMRNSVRVRMPRDRLKYDQVDSFSGLDRTFDDSVPDRARTDVTNIVEEP